LEGKLIIFLLNLLFELSALSLEPSCLQPKALRPANGNPHSDFPIQPSLPHSLTLWFLISDF
jgi:hypothetical protein